MEIQKLEKISGINGTLLGVSFYIAWFLQQEVFYSPYHLRYYATYSLPYNKRRDHIIDEFINFSWNRRVSENIFSSLLKNEKPIDIISEAIKTTRKGIEETLKQALKIREKIKKGELEESIRLFNDLLKKSYATPGIMTFIYESFLSDMAIKYLNKKRSMEKTALLLSNPSYKSWIIEQEKLLQNIKNKQRNKDIKQYIWQYFHSFTNYAHLVRVETKDDVLSLTSKVEAHDKGKDEDLRERWEKEYKRTNEKEKRIIKFVHLTEELRDVRKYLYMIHPYISFMLLDKYLEQEKLERYRETFKYLRLEELAACITSEDEQILKDNIKKAKHRMKGGFSLIYYDYCWTYIYGFADKYLIPPKAQNVKTLSGTPASIGKQKGRVVIIKSPKDFSKIKEGKILVTR